MKEIKCTNIIYIGHISKLGGVETYAYNMAKKYKNYDIMVLCKQGDSNQLERIREYCPAQIWNGETVKCESMIINCDTSILDYVEERRSDNGNSCGLFATLLQTIPELHAPENQKNNRDYKIHLPDDEREVQY